MSYHYIIRQRFLKFTITVQLQTEEIVNLTYLLFIFSSGRWDEYNLQIDQRCLDCEIASGGVSQTICWFSICCGTTKGLILYQYYFTEKYFYLLLVAGYFLITTPWQQKWFYWALVMTCWTSWGLVDSVGQNIIYTCTKAYILNYFLQISDMQLSGVYCICMSVQLTQSMCSPTLISTV